MQAAETYIPSCHRVLSRVSHSDALVVTPRVTRQDRQASSANLPARDMRKKCTFVTVGKTNRARFLRNYRVFSRSPTPPKRHREDLICRLRHRRHVLTAAESTRAESE
jgi:hypothetical protein